MINYGLHEILEKMIILLNIMRKEKKARKQEYFRLLDTSLPIIETKNELNSNRYGMKKTRNTFHQSPEKHAERILRSQQFLYIDLDDQNGCRPMEKSERPDEDHQQVQKVGRNYISNLKYLSERNQQTIDYLQRSRELQDQKKSIRKIIKGEMDRSLQKLKARKSYRIDYTALNKNKQPEYDPLKLRKMIQDEAFQTMNQSIWQKQKRLIDKFGIVSNYISKDKRNQKSLMNSRKVVDKKMQLPSIVFRTIDK